MTRLQEYIEKMKNVQSEFLQFIDMETNEEEYYENVNQILEDDNIIKDKHDLKIFLYIINQISNEHHRYQHFFEKFEKILAKYRKEIQTHFTNDEIFNIFSQNKRILLFLFKEKIISINDHIFHEMINIPTYFQYFSPEIKTFIEERNQQSMTEYYEKIQNITNITTFNRQRNKGENESLICGIIRKDSINEFISFANRNNSLLNNYIKQSIFETNPFLLNRNEVTLIEYAAFFGSIQIFKYLLYKNKDELKETLWIYAIHSNNKKIIQILKKSDIKLYEDEMFKSYFNKHESDYDSTKAFDNKLKMKISYERCVFEAIKCHHNDIATFIAHNFVTDYLELSMIGGLCSYNFALIPKEQICDLSLFYGCKYDYYDFVKLYLDERQVDLNTTIS